MTYTVGTLFSGIGVPDLCAELLGMRTVWAVEKEAYPQKVLRRHFPHLEIRGDIFDCHDLPYVDFVIAGFPCQPFSSAGKKMGEKDERYLVPEMLRVLQEVKPRVILLENVSGFAALDNGNTFKQLLRALAEMGFDAEWCHLRASDFGAPHQRERWFLVAYRESAKCQCAGDTRRRRIRFANGSSGLGDPTRQRILTIQQQRQLRCSKPSSVANTSSQRGGTRRTQRAKQERNTALIQSSKRHVESRMGRSSHGLTYRLDEIGRFPARPSEPQYEWEPPRVTSGKVANRTNRLKAIGNSMVVPVVYAVMQSVLTWLQE